MEESATVKAEAGDWLIVNVDVVDWLDSDRRRRRRQAQVDAGVAGSILHVDHLVGPAQEEPTTPEHHPGCFPFGFRQIGMAFHWFY